MRNLKSLWVILQNEPVLTRTAVGAVLVLVSQFVPVSDGVTAAVDGVVVALLAFNARSKVTPVDPAPRAILGKAGDNPTPDVLGKA